MRAFMKIRRGLLLLLAMAACAAALPALARGATPDYAAWDEVLLQNVRNGYVDYDGIRANPKFAAFVGELGQADALDLAAAVGVEEAELHRLGIGREQGEVDAVSVPGRAQRLRPAGAQAPACGSHALSGPAGRTG